MIEVRSIRKSFGSLEVLKGIDLDISKGEVVSIVGPSGAGKTTLLQIMGTLDKPDSGSVRLDGVAMESLDRKEMADFRNRRIGFVFQFHQLLPEFTALENVMIPAYIGRASTSEAKARHKNCWTSWDCPAGLPTSLTSFREEKSSGWLWHALWSTILP